MHRVFAPAFRVVPQRFTSASVPRRNTAVSWHRSLVTTYYTKDHETVAYDDESNSGKIRITDYAQSSLGDVVFVELPAAGSQVKQGDQIGAVESVKAASDIYAPVSGTVSEINEALNDKPGQLSSKDNDINWLCNLKLSNPEELKNLMSAEEYKEHCETESD